MSQGTIASINEVIENLERDGTKVKSTKTYEKGIQKVLLPTNRNYKESQNKLNGVYIANNDDLVGIHTYTPVNNERFNFLGVFRKEVNEVVMMVRTPDELSILSVEKTSKYGYPPHIKNHYEILPKLNPETILDQHSKYSHIEIEAMRSLGINFPDYK